MKYLIRQTSFETVYFLIVCRIFWASRALHGEVLIHHQCKFFCVCLQHSPLFTGSSVQSHEQALQEALNTMAKRPTGIEDRLSTCEKALRLLLQVALATCNSSQVEQKEEVKRTLFEFVQVYAAILR